MKGTRWQAYRLLRILRRFVRKPANILAFAFLAIMGLVGIFADVIASEKPIIARVNDQLFVLPAIFHAPELMDIDNQTIRRKLASDEGWAILPPVPYGPNQSKVNGHIDWLAPPGHRHLLGTDNNGRDVLARLIHGARSALLVGVGAMIICAIVGIFLGALSAYFGGGLDRVTTLMIETMTAFPTLFLILAIQGLLGIASLWQLVVVIGATSWVDVARVTRAEVLRTVNEEFVDAARALGLGHLRILIRHVMPVVMGPVLVSATFVVANAILVESTLSFLGYGAPPPVASWGQLLADAFENAESYWLVIFPGAILSLTVLSINIVGEALGDAVEP